MAYKTVAEKVAGEGWRSDEAPAEGQRVRVLCEDHVGTYEVPFPVEFREDDWHNAGTGEKLYDDAHVAGWRPWTDGRRA